MGKKIEKSDEELKKKKKRSNRKIQITENPF